MSINFPFTCPFCSRDTTVSENDFEFTEKILDIDNSDKLGILTTQFIVCPNPKCKKTSLKLTLYKKGINKFGNFVKLNKTEEWQLLPSSSAKVFPDYIPQAINDDYKEACSILNLSPKASATLARRCIQGMIRDFWKIKKPDGYKGPWRLVEEIENIKDKVEPDVWDAINAVRKIGNIGAHMEEDINLIIDVEPGESEKLLGLIEMLIEEWYINKYKRQLRLTEIKEIVNIKKK